MNQPFTKRAAARWIVLTATGLSAGILSALVLGGPVEAVVGMVLVTPVLTGIVGAALGVSQWIELRRLLRRPLLWVLATCAGLGAGLAVGVVIVELVGRAFAGQQVRLLQLGMGLRALSFAVVGLVAGLCVGLAQKFALRSGGCAIPGWVAACGAGLSLAFAASSLLVDALLGGLASPAAIALLVVSAGVIFGAVTARPLRQAA